jgi:pSer/pThr/pTyr-binding forkhead associated (FHA) protein
MDGWMDLGTFTVTIVHETTETSVGRRFSAAIQADSPCLLRAHKGAKRNGKRVSLKDGRLIEWKSVPVPFTKPRVVTFIVDNKWYLTCRFSLNESGSMVVRFVHGYEHMLPR